MSSPQRSDSALSASRRTAESAPARPQAWDAATGARVRQIRLARGWSQRRLIHAMRLAARRQHRELPADESMISMVSRWENGRRVPDEYNRRLLCDALEVTPGDLRSSDPDPLLASIVLTRLAGRTVAVPPGPGARRSGTPGEGVARANPAR